jgi:hypothetical protein
VLRVLGVRDQIEEVPAAYKKYRSYEYITALVNAD